MTLTLRFESPGNRSYAGFLVYFISLSYFSGYDFGYLLKVLTNTNLPTEEQEFFELLKLYFCNIYDVKYLMKSCKNLKGGLQEVSEQLEVGAVCVGRIYNHGYKSQLRLGYSDGNS